MNAESLGQAWLDASEVIPIGTHLSVYYDGFSQWAATFQHAYTECERCGTVHQCGGGLPTTGHGATPEAALRALMTERIR